MVKRRYRTEASEAIHSAASALAQASVIDRKAMREYDELCIEEVRESTANDVNATVSARVKNSTSADYRVHVFDLFGGGRVEVQGSPFSLSEGDASPAFALRANATGAGAMAYACDAGPSLSDISVVNGEIKVIT
ncbi:hypothetical protein G3A43_07380 [Paraburkholderia aspalathi]|nr:hypothetical protein [Paraburkholderia aspalathi]MBK3780075.1 hypothetical protein [Paraburkholderia aspalathi]